MKQANKEKIQQAFKDLSFIPQLYIVGGAVRDYIMGNEIADIDVCSANTPEQIIKIIDKIIAEHEELRDTFSEKYPNEYQNTPDIKYYLTGIDHGTITIVANGNSYEHTTFRKDTSCDGRHAEVEYTDDLFEDAGRRDFRINSMYMNKNMEIIDHFGGQGDINNKELNTVGFATKRFEEDYLRIVRAVRFMTRFGMRMHYDMIEDIKAAAPKLMGNVAIERIVQEIDKAFKMKSPAPGQFIMMLHHLNILNQFLPELSKLYELEQNPEYHPEGDVLTHTCQVINRHPSWHALFHDIGKLYTAEPHKTGNWMTFYNHDRVGANKVTNICRRLKLSNKLTREIEMVCKYHMKTYQLKKPSKLRQFVLDIKGYEDCIKAVFAADHPGNVWPALETEPAWPTGDEIKAFYNIPEGREVGIKISNIKKYWVATGKLDISKG